MKISHGKLLRIVHLNWAAFTLSTSFNNSNEKEEAKIITNDISLRLIFSFWKWRYFTRFLEGRRCEADCGAGVSYCFIVGWLSIVAYVIVVKQNAYVFDNLSLLESWTNEMVNFEFELLFYVSPKFILCSIHEMLVLFHFCGWVRR